MISEGCVYKIHLNISFFLQFMHTFKRNVLFLQTVSEKINGNNHRKDD